MHEKQKEKKKKPLYMMKESNKFFEIALLFKTLS